MHPMTCANARATRTWRSAALADGARLSAKAQRDVRGCEQPCKQTWAAFETAGCIATPQHDAIVIHRIKGAAGLVYVWRVLQGTEPFDAINCARASATELPRNSFIFQPSFLQRVRAGLLHVTFDPKTNRVAMIFQPSSELDSAARLEGEGEAAAAAAAATAAGSRLLGRHYVSCNISGLGGTPERHVSRGRPQHCTSRPSACEVASKIGCVKLNAFQ